MSKDLISVQYLRAAVAVMVVLHHLPVQLERLGYRGHWPEVFNSRVDIFFVISGFIMWVTTAGRNLSPQEFLYRRLVRIVPLYWLVTAFAVAVMLLAPQAMQSSRFDLAHVLSSFAFWPTLHPITGHYAPVLIPGWTLNYEMFFYVVFAACLSLQPHLRLAAITLVMVGFVAFPLVVSQAAGGFYTSSIMLEFVLGLCIGALFNAGYKVPLGSALGLIGVGAASLSLGPEVIGSMPRLVFYGVPSAVLLAGLVFFERAKPVPKFRPLIMLGRASYALFVTHGIVLAALGLAWRKAGATNLPWSVPLFGTLAVVLVIAVALLVHRFIEKPLSDYFRRRRASGRDATPFGVTAAQPTG
jgi:exopolysaccharide production protein ExoZ